MSFWDFISKSEWPAVVLILAIYFRSVFKSLLEGLSITKASFGGGSIEFQNRIDKLEKISSSQDKTDIPPETQSDIPRKTPENPEGHKNLLHWTEVEDWLESNITPDVPPSYMIMMYWTQLEKALLSATEKLTSANIIPDVRRNALMPMQWRDAVKFINLDDQTIFGIRELNSLRNQAAHGKELAISTTDALRYRDLAIKYIYNINQAAHEMLQKNSKKV